MKTGKKLWTIVYCMLFVFLVTSCRNNNELSQTLQSEQQYEKDNEQQNEQHEQQNEQHEQQNEQITDKGNADYGYEEKLIYDDLKREDGAMIGCFMQNNVPIIVLQRYEEQPMYQVYQIVDNQMQYQAKLSQLLATMRSTIEGFHASVMTLGADGNYYVGDVQNSDYTLHNLYRIHPDLTYERIALHTIDDLRPVSFYVTENGKIYLSYEGSSNYEMIEYDTMHGIESNLGKIGNNDYLDVDVYGNDLFALTYAGASVEQITPGDRSYKERPASINRTFSDQISVSAEGIYTLDADGIKYCRMDGTLWEQILDAEDMQAANQTFMRGNLLISDDSFYVAGYGLMEHDTYKIYRYQKISEDTMQ